MVMRQLPGNAFGFPIRLGKNKGPFKNNQQHVGEALEVNLLNRRVLRRDLPEFFKYAFSPFKHRLPDDLHGFFIKKSRLLDERSIEAAGKRFIKLVHLLLEKLDKYQQLLQRIIAKAFCFMEGSFQVCNILIGISLYKLVTQVGFAGKMMKEGTLTDSGLFNNPIYGGPPETVFKNQGLGRVHNGETGVFRIFFHRMNNNILISLYQFQNLLDLNICKSDIYGKFIETNP